MFAGPNIQKKLDYICLLNIFLVYNFEEFWVAMAHQAKLFCYSRRKSQLHIATHFYNVGLLTVLQSEWLRAARTITQKLELL